MQFKWQATTAERYWYALEVLPPAYMGHGGFLVGEPADHALCTVTGIVRARFEGFVEPETDRFYVSDRPVTIPEFKAADRPARDNDGKEEQTTA